MMAERVTKNEINVIGKPNDVDKFYDLLSGIDTLRDEGKLRLDIQYLLDDNNLNIKVLCNGNCIVPYKRIVKEYDKLRESDNLDKLSDYFYKFLNSECIRKSFKNKMEFIKYYENSFDYVQREVIDVILAPAWKTDLKRVLDKIQSEIRIW